MESSFWEHHWWLVFALAALIIPVGGIIASTFTTYLAYRHRREALSALKAYADSGRTPPPEVVEALKGHAGVGPGFGPASGGWAGDPTAGMWNDPGLWSGDRYERRAARQAMRAARWRYREPYRRWSGVVWLAALTVGFGFASQHAGGDTAGAFMLTAIILGAATVGSIATAIIATIMRP
jgi:hypothetical protein